MPVSRNRSSGRKSASHKKLWAVDLYQPLMGAIDFHPSTAKWRLLLGSNRSGKTLAAAVEFARAVMNKDPYKKYRTRHGYAVVIGLDSDHIGMLWRKLSLPGMMAYQDQPSEVPPLIPESMIDGSIAWQDKARAVPRLIKFKTGWRVLFLSSRGMVRQGEHYDLVWIDEQISNPQLFWEAVRGLVDVDPQWRSYGIWSATPQKQNPLLWDLHQKTLVSDDVRTFTFLLQDNIHIGDDAKAWFADFLPEAERQVRVEGHFASEYWRIYPYFDINGVHGVEPFSIPEDWTFHLGLDPGTANCATVFGAVPPDNKYLYIFDELLLNNADALTWAKAVQERYAAVPWECWVIDRRAGRSRGMGSSIQVAAQYWQAAQECGLRPRVTGPMQGFLPGLDIVEARWEEVRRALKVTDSEGLIGQGLKFFRGKTPQLTYQLQTAQLDEKNPKQRIRGHFDLLDALEYLVASRPIYVEKPHAVTKKSHDIYEAFMRDRMKHRRHVVHALGMGIG